MGKNNRQRRAAKNRKRAPKGERRSGQAGRRTRNERRTEGPVGPTELFRAAVYSLHHGDDELVRSSIYRLASMPKLPTARAIEEALELEVSRLWTVGWQPVDLDRSVHRELGADERALLRMVIASQAREYDALGAEVAPEWMRQVAALAAALDPDRKHPYLLELGRDWPEVLLVSVRTMRLVRTLPELPTLVPPPSAWREGVATRARSNLPTELLDKVRGLLAKAESTSFEAEAEAFTAKAQELMASHRIDRAVLSATEKDRREEPIGRRLTIDDPYADAKAVLLGVIAGANGGRSVWCKDMGFSTVFAFVDEIDAIDELFTSLLVQATAALRREGSKHDHRGRSRTTRFRRSFLVAFAHRIGERLNEAVDGTVAEAQASSGEALLPILAARDRIVHEAVEEAFPEMGHFNPSASDAEGWFAGTLFGDRADVSMGEMIDERAAS